jgi:hypothetical protein
MRSSKWSIAEARLWQKATAPHNHAMQLIRAATEGLFGSIASLGNHETGLRRDPDDPLQEAEHIVQALQRPRKLTDSNQSHLRPHIRLQV